MTEGIYSEAPNETIHEYDENIKKPIEVQKIADIPIEAGTFYFHSGHTLDLQENAPKILAGDASTVYKVTNETREKYGESIQVEKHINATVIDIKKLIKPILIYRSSDIEPFLHAIDQQLNTDRTVVNASNWKIRMLSGLKENPDANQAENDKSIEEEQERLKRAKQVRLNNYKSAQILIDKLESFKFQYEDCKKMIDQVKGILELEKKELDEESTVKITP